MLRPLRGAREALVALALATSLGGAAVLPACGPGPCDRLQHKVCEELKDKRRCKIMEDEERRAHLSDEACQRMLKQIRRR